MNERAREQVNERAVAAGICRILDEGTQYLPWRVSERLAAARAQALARVIVPAPNPARAMKGGLNVGMAGGIGAASGLPAGAAGFMSSGASKPASASVRVEATRVEPRRSLGPTSGVLDGWSRRRRVFATALPIALMLVGFVLVDFAQQEQSANELLEVDSALLTDEVPLVAYADRGFGVFIRNTRQ